jgi:diguanylate cyclase (GGDEF)-like protein
MLKSFMRRMAQASETAGEDGEPAGAPTTPQEPLPAERPPASSPAIESKPSDIHPVALALGMHQASSLAALVDAATAAAAYQFEGAPLLILIRGRKEDLTLASGLSDLTTELHTQINRAFEQDSESTKLAISGPAAVALCEAPTVRRMSSLADLLGEVMGDKACRQAQAKLETVEVVAVRLEHTGDTLGLAVYLMKRPQTDLDAAKALADHFAVALANLRARDEARRYGMIDPIRWILDQDRFFEELNREVSRATRHGGKLAVLLLVILNLEKLRAEFGPSQANRLLRAVGATMSGELRASDTLAAYREDGFGLILPETDDDGAALLANRLKDLASQVSIFGSAAPVPKIECAVGTAGFPKDGESAVELAAAAESRLLGLDWPLAKTGSD